MRLRHALMLVLLVACNGSPTEPSAQVLRNGFWTGDNACLSVPPSTALKLRVGCGHGELPRPQIRADGTFDVDGTYRVEIGPVSIDPPPPAHYSGMLTSSTLTLTVRPSVSSLPPATYRLHFSPSANCGPACV